MRSAMIDHVASGPIRIIVLLVLATAARGQDDSLPDLVSALESNRWEARRAAEDALGRLGAGRIESPLEELLAGSPSPNLRSALEEVLVRTRGTYRWWRRRLGEPGWEVDAVELVLAAPESGRTIARLLAERDPIVVQRARRIERWAPTRATLPERLAVEDPSRLESLSELCEAIEHASGRDLESLALRLVKMDDERATRAVLEALARVDDPSGLWDRLFARQDKEVVAAYLSFQVEHRTWSWEEAFLAHLLTRWSPAEAAELVGAGDTGALLSEFIRDRLAGLAAQSDREPLGYDHIARKVVPIVLDAFDRPDVEHAILTWLADVDPSIRRAAYYALGAWPCPEGWRTVDRRVADLDAREISMAVEAAFRSGERAALEFGYAHAARAHVREADELWGFAWFPLRPWSYHADRVQADSLELVRRNSDHLTPWAAEHALRARLALGDETVWPVLRTAFERRSGPCFGPWAMNLVRAGVDAVIESVIAGLDYPDLRTVAHAAHIVAECDLTGAIPILRRLLSDRDPVRVAVARLTLARLGDQDEIQRMGPLLADQESFFGLGRFQPNTHLGFGGDLDVPEWARYASEHLRELFWSFGGVGARSEGWYLRGILARSLAASGQRYYDPAESRFDPQHDVDLLAIELRRGRPLEGVTLRGLDGAESIHLAEKLALMAGDPRETDETRARALDDLLRIAPVRALEPSESGLSDPEAPGLRFAAARCLGSSGDPRAVPILETALADPDRDVRGAALEALLALGVRRPAGLTAERLSSFPLAATRSLAIALAEEPRPTDRPILEALLEHAIPATRMAARRGLDRLE